MTERTRRQAREQLRGLVAVGVLLALLGFGVAALMWPHDSLDAFGNVKHHGVAFLAALAALVGWVGNALLAVGLVGYGVMLGREASPDRVEA